MFVTPPRAAGKKSTELMPGHEHRNRPGRSSRAPAAPAASVTKVGVEDVRRRRLRVAAGPLAAEPLVPALGLVAAGQVPVVGHAAGELPVVAVLRVGRVEVRRVVEALALLDRQERRIEDVRARAAVAGELIAPLRILRLDQQVVLQHAAIVRVVVPVRIAAIDFAVRIDDEALKPRVVGPRPRVVQIAALNRVARRHRVRSS